MKKSYKKMLIFQTIVFLVLCLNSFMSNVLGKYNIVIFLVVLLALFKFIFGFEKDRHQYTKDIIFEIMIFILIFFILFYFSGLIFGFAKTNYLNYYGIKIFILPLLLTIILKEILRYMIIKKSEGSKLLFITTIVLFVFLDVTNTIYYNGFKTSYNTFIFFALSLLPALSGNIVYSFLSQKSGYKPVIVYLLVMELYSYLLPLVPNPNEYIVSLITLLLPIFMYYRIKHFWSKYEDKELDRNYKKKNITSLILPGILTIIVVYFTSGYFKYQALAIASGSMSPKIEKGDVVIIEKLEKDDFNGLDIGGIIAFEHKGVVVVHRIINIIKEDGEYYFYTKGDANNKEDNYSISEEDIIGSVKIRIPFVGYPTVWLNEM